MSCPTGCDHALGKACNPREGSPTYTDRKVHSKGVLTDANEVQFPFLTVRHEDGEITVGVPWDVWRNAELGLTVAIPDDLSHHPTPGGYFKLTW